VVDQCHVFEHARVVALGQGVQSQPVELCPIQGFLGKVCTSVFGTPGAGPAQG
jgi:hypothetical protein